MAFTIAGLLEKAILGIGLSKDAVEAKAAQIAAQYPDLAARQAALKAWLDSQVPDAATIAGTLAGIAKDIASGVTGIDPGAWQASI